MRFVRQLRRFHDIGARVVPVPDVAAKMIAIVDVTEGEIITYVSGDILRGSRAEWVARFDAFDQRVKADGGAAELFRDGNVALLNEGARIFRAFCAVFHTFYRSYVRWRDAAC